MQQPNPFFDSPPGSIKQGFILEQGTEQEKRWLLEWAEASMTDEDRQKAEKQRAYDRKVFGERGKGPDAETKLSTSGLRMRHLMMEGFATRAAVTEEHIIASKRLLYQAYRETIWKRSKAEPIIERGDQVSRILSAAVYWILGIESPEGSGFNPRKSLYFCGPTGNGKSSIAKAIHFASHRLYHDFEIGFPLGIRSMKRVVTEIYAGKTLEPIKDLSEGHLILDEIRTEQIEIKHFGNEVPIVADVLYNRYDSWDFDARQTLITTNLKPAQLCEALGDSRLTDRINDQYQVVLFTGGPFRDTQMQVWQ